MTIVFLYTGITNVVGPIVQILLRLDNAAALQYQASCDGKMLNLYCLIANVIGGVAMHCCTCSKY